MEACHFSETQFEAYHSRQLEKEISSNLPQFFPTRNEEGGNGIDMVHFTNYANLFFQYKVPVSIAAGNRKCVGMHGDFYRMKIYHRTNRLSQYKLLWDWAETEEHVYYATPEFHTDFEFSAKYYRILNHTAHFKLREGFIDPLSVGFDDHEHYIYYSNRDSFALMYSNESNEVKKTNLTNVISNIGSSKLKKTDFNEYLKNTNEKIIELLRKYDFMEGRQGNIDPIIDRILNKENISGWDQYYLCKYRLRKYFGLDWIILKTDNE